MKKIKTLLFISIFTIFGLVSNPKQIFAADESVIIFPAANKTCNIYPKASAKNALTYTNPLFQRDAPYLGESNGYYKTMVSGVSGYISKSCVSGSTIKKVSKLPYFSFNTGGKSISALDVSRYQVVGNKMYFALVYGNYITYNIGYTDVPKGLSNNKAYYSYDGIYYYTNYNTMVSDYKKKTRKNASNASNPYYDYYQYLPMRSVSNISGAALDKRLLQVQSNAASKYSQTLKFSTNCKGGAIYTSKYNGYYSNVYKKGSVFAGRQSAYQVNAGVLYGIMLNESANGTSNLSRHYNNPFGWGAVDSCPNSATRYDDMTTAINKYYSNMSSMYANPVHDFGGKGTHLGNKQSGANVKYASDPHWGYKNAYNYRKADEAAGNVDKNKKKLGILKTSKTALDGSVNNEYVKVYTTASTSSKSPYYYERNGASVIILGTSGNFYKVQKDNAKNAGTVYIPKANVYQVNTSISQNSSTATTKVSYQKSGNKHYIWGANSKGQMGNGSLAEVISSKKIDLNNQIPKGEVIKSVVYNNNNVYILTNSGKVYSSGDNSYGQRSYKSIAKKFSQVATATRKVSAISISGSRLTMKITGTSDYFYVGQNAFNPTVNKFTKNSNNPIRVRYSSGSKVSNAWYYEKNETGRVSYSYIYNTKHITRKNEFKYFTGTKKSFHRYYNYSNGKKKYAKQLKYNNKGKILEKREWYYQNGVLKSSSKTKAKRYITSYKNGKATTTKRQYYTTKGKLQKAVKIAVRK